MIKKTIIAAIKGYSFLISPLIGKNCRFYPTCSEYTQKSIQKHGVLKGGVMGLIRICKCQPWHNGKFDDPVPESIAWRAVLGYKKRK